MVGCARSGTGRGHRPGSRSRATLSFLGAACSGGPVERGTRAQRRGWVVVHAGCSGAVQVRRVPPAGGVSVVKDPPSCTARSARLRSPLRRVTPAGMPSPLSTISRTRSVSGGDGDGQFGGVGVPDRVADGLPGNGLGVVGQVGRQGVDLFGDPDRGVPVLSCRTFDSWHRVSPIGAPGFEGPDSIVQVTRSIWRLAIPCHPTVPGYDVFVRPVLLNWSAGRDRGGRGAQDVCRCGGHPLRRSGPRTWAALGFTIAVVLSQLRVRRRQS